MVLPPLPAAELRSAGPRIARLLAVDSGLVQG